MKNKLKIATLFNTLGNDYYKFFSNYFDIDLTENPNEEGVDIALFTGGEDVNPEYYNENIGNNTYINKKRDVLEIEFYNSIPKNILKVGICRGSQFLTVMNNAKLIQHVTNHGISHEITTIDNNKINVTSTHHQMMFPYVLDKNEYEIIGWATNNLSEKYLNGNNENIILPLGFVECEIVKYHNSKSLCIQGHPEFSHADINFKKYIIKLIKNELQK